MKRILRYRGLLVIVLWQAAPTRFDFGAGGGLLEYYSPGSCDRPAEYSETNYRHVAGKVEHFAQPRMRVQASLGVQWSDSSSSTGPFGSFLLSFEGRKFGIGAGGAMVHGTVERTRSDSTISKEPRRVPMPSLYLRVGAREGLHVRAEAYAPDVTSASESFGLLVGYNQFNPRKPSISFGRVGIHENADDLTHSAYRFELIQPVSSRVALGVTAFTGKGSHHPVQGITGRVRLTFD